MDTYFYDAEMETGEMPLLPKLGWGVQTNPCIPASEVKPPMWIKSNSRVVSNQGTFEVIGEARPIFGGAYQIKVKDYSQGGVEIHTTLVYQAGESVEVVSK